MKHRNSDTFAHWSKSLVALFLGVVVLTGCGKDGFKKKYEDEKAAKAELQKKLDKANKAREKNAKAVFFVNLGEFRTKEGAEVTGDSLLKMLKEDSLSKNEGALEKIMDEGQGTGALANYFKAEGGYKSWWSSKELSHHLLTLIPVLELMKSLKAKVDGKKENFKREEFEKLIKDTETKLKSGKKYKMNGTTDGVEPDPNGAEIKPLDADKFKKVWAAFKAELIDAINAYSEALGVAVKTEEKKEGDKADAAADGKNS